VTDTVDWISISEAAKRFGIAGSTIYQYVLYDGPWGCYQRRDKIYCNAAILEAELVPRVRANKEKQAKYQVKRTPEELASRRRLVMELRAEGMILKDVARKLGVSPSRVHAIEASEFRKRRRREQNEAQAAPCSTASMYETVKATH
jgi:DNA-binding NarL/FixJ family response regulator